MAAALVFLGAGCMPSQQAPVATGPITIGWVGPLTGDAASIGKDSLDAAKAAVAEINRNGGIGGRELRISPQDGKCTADGAVAAENELIDTEHVPVIIGGMCSGETIAMAPIAEQKHVVVFSACSSAPSITSAGDYIFRSYPSDSYQGRAAANYIYNTLGKRKAAVIALMGDYGSGIKLSFTDAFKSLGGDVVSTSDYAQDAHDLTKELTAAKDSGADIVYFVGYTESSLLALKQAKELGITAPFFGADAWDDPAIHNSVYADGISYTVPATNFNPAWRKKMEALNVNLSVCTPGSYDNVMIIADIMRRFGTEASTIKKQLYNVKDWPGANGSISLDMNGDLVGAQYEVKTVHRGTPTTTP